jgi:hypothetical protein
MGRAGHAGIAPSSVFGRFPAMQDLDFLLLAQ